MLWPDIQVGFEILVISIIGRLLPGNKYNETCFENILAWEMTVSKRRLYIIGRVYDQHFVQDDHFIMRYFHGIFSERIHSNPKAYNLYGLILERQSLFRTAAEMFSR